MDIMVQAITLTGLIIVFVGIMILLGTVTVSTIEDIQDRRNRIKESEAE